MLRIFFIHFSKDVAGNKKTERMNLENKLKTLETSPSFVDNPEYTKTNEISKALSKLLKSVLPSLILYN